VRDTGCEWVEEYASGWELLLAREFWLPKESGIDRECVLVLESGLAVELAMVGVYGRVSESVLELKWESL